MTEPSATATVSHLRQQVEDLCDHVALLHALVAVEGHGDEETARMVRALRESCGQLSDGLDQLGPDQAATHNAALQESLDFLKALTISTVHDLRSPLVSSYEVCRQLLSRGESLEPAQRRRLIGLVTESLEESIGLLDELEDFQLSGELPATSTRQECTLDDVLEEATEGLDLSRHHLTMDVPAVGVWCDPVLLRRLVHNLLQNVVQHTPPGTHAHVGVQRSSHSLVVAVSDNGPGIPAEFREPALLPLQQGTSPAASDTRRGLGLALARHFARLQGGDLWIAATSAGTEVRVQLPIRDGDGND